MNTNARLPRLRGLRRLPKTRRALFALWNYDAWADEKRWDMRFARSQRLLAQLADEARAEYEAGRTRALVLSEL